MSLPTALALSLSLSTIAMDTVTCVFPEDGQEIRVELVERDMPLVRPLYLAKIGSFKVAAEAKPIPSSEALDVVLRIPLTAVEYATMAMRQDGIAMLNLFRVEAGEPHDAGTFVGTCSGQEEHFLAWPE